jgi:hypothetical protein
MVSTAPPELHNPLPTIIIGWSRPKNCTRPLERIAVTRTIIASLMTCFLLAGCSSPAAPTSPWSTRQLTQTLSAKLPDGYWSWSWSRGPLPTKQFLQSADRQVTVNVRDAAVAPARGSLPDPGPNTELFADFAIGGTLYIGVHQQRVDRFGVGSGPWVGSASLWMKSDATGQYWAAVSAGFPVSRRSEVERIMKSVRIVASATGQ